MLDEVLIKVSNKFIYFLQAHILIYGPVMIYTSGLDSQKVSQIGAL